MERDELKMLVLKYYIRKEEKLVKELEEVRRRKKIIIDQLPKVDYNID